MELTELLKLLSWLFRMGCKECTRKAVPVIRKTGSLSTGELAPIMYFCPRHAMDYVSPVKTVKLASKLTAKNPLSQVKLPTEIG